MGEMPAYLSCTCTCSLWDMAEFEFMSYALAVGLGRNVSMTCPCLVDRISLKCCVHPACRVGVRIQPREIFQQGRRPAIYMP